MFKNANIFYEIKNSKRRRYYAKFQDLAFKRRREIFYEMEPRDILKVGFWKVQFSNGLDFNRHLWQL